MPEYIERAAAAKIICAWCGTCPNPTVEDLLKCDDICPEFAQIPTAADVRPVVRGHWTNHRTLFTDGDWHCSACGKAITIYMGPDREDRYAYCPNCGADMREEI